MTARRPLLVHRLVAPLLAALMAGYPVRVLAQQTVPVQPVPPPPAGWQAPPQAPAQAPLQQAAPTWVPPPAQYVPPPPAPPPAGYAQPVAPQAAPAQQAPAQAPPATVQAAPVYAPPAPAAPVYAPPAPPPAAAAPVYAPPAAAPAYPQAAPPSAAVQSAPVYAPPAAAPAYPQAAPPPAAVQGAPVYAPPAAPAAPVYAAPAVPAPVAPAPAAVPAYAQPAPPAPPPAAAPPTYAQPAPPAPGAPAVVVPPGAVPVPQSAAPAPAPRSPEQDIGAAPPPPAPKKKAPPPPPTVVDDRLIRLEWRPAYVEGNRGYGPMVQTPVIGSDRRPLYGKSLYLALGRSDLAEDYERRLAAKRIMGVSSALLFVSGIVVGLTSLGVHGCNAGDVHCFNDRDEQLKNRFYWSGGLVLGGAVMGIASSSYSAHPVDRDELVGLIREYNNKVRSQAGIRVSPVLTPGGGGVGVSGSW